MNVCITSYQSAMLLKGGPKTQMLQTRKGLEELGVNVTLYDSWKELKKGEKSTKEETKLKEMMLAR